MKKEYNHFSWNKKPIKQINKISPVDLSEIKIL
jgi:hypothetical protein